MTDLGPPIMPGHDARTTHVGFVNGCPDCARYWGDPNFGESGEVDADGTFIPTQGERKRARRKVMDNRRSVMLISALSSGQQRRQSGRRKRGA